MSLQDLIEHQEGIGLRAARAWMAEQVQRELQRLKKCRPDELGALQGRIEMAERFLKIFEGSPNGG